MVTLPYQFSVEVQNDYYVVVLQITINLIMVLQSFFPTVFAELEATSHAQPNYCDLALQHTLFDIDSSSVLLEHL